MQALSAAGPGSSALTALPTLGLLNRVHDYACAALGRNALSARRLRPFASTPYELCGLEEEGAKQTKEASKLMRRSAKIFRSPKRQRGSDSPDHVSSWPRPRPVAGSLRKETELPCSHKGVDDVAEESPVSEPWEAPSEAAILLKIESLDSGLTALSRPGEAPHLRNHLSAIQGETVRQPEISRPHKSSFSLVEI